MIGSTIKTGAVSNNNNQIHNSGNTDTNSNNLNVDSGNTNSFNSSVINAVIQNATFNASTNAHGARDSAPEHFQEFKVRIKLPFQRNRNFCGREDILDKMQQILEPRNSAKSPVEMPIAKRGAKKRKSVILHGLGGIGKSQIALEYAHRFHNLYTSIFWIDAENVSRTTNSACKIVEQLVVHYIAKPRFSDYQEIAKVLGIPGKIDPSGKIRRGAEELAMAVVHNWLSTSENRGWLLLVDNHDKPAADTFDNLFPTCDWGSFIITTRLPNLRRHGVCIEVAEIGSEAGLELLLESSGIIEEEMSESELQEAQELVQDLGELPLALDQAGAYICSLQIPVSAYRERLKTGLSAGFDEELLDPSLSPYKSSVLKTWELSFQELSDDARHLLHMCAFLSNEDIPEELFRRSKSAVPWITEDKNRLDKAIRSLFTFSLAKRKESNDSLWIHRLVHTWAREHTDIASQRRNAEDTLALVASAIVADEHNRSPEDYIFERRILNHLKICQEHISTYFTGSDSIKAAEASFAMSVVFQELGDLQQAEDLCGRSIDGYEKALGRDHPLCLEAIHRMGYILYRERKCNEALKLNREALAGKEKIFGSEHPSTLETMHNLAHVVCSAGYNNEALDLYQKALAGKEIALGKDHRSTLQTVNSIASIFSTQGRHDEALIWCRRALVGLEKALGHDHPETLWAVNAMGYTFDSQGRHHEALALYKRALGGRERALGEDHPLTLETIDAIAAILKGQGRLDEALEWYEKALVRREKALGEDHPKNLTAIHAIAWMFRNHKRYDEAFEWHRKSLVRREKALGEDHPGTLDTIDAIAAVLCNQDRYDEAVEWYEKALIRREKVLGKHHFFTQHTVNSMVSCLGKMGRFTEARQLKERFKQSQMY
ncbi:hypothetical protein RUND412_001502 [Rhizina undulata]